MFQIKTKFAPKALIPTNAIERDWATTPDTQNIPLQTMDGKIAQIRVIGAYNNAEGGWNDHFDEICQELYKMPFSAVQSNYKARLGYITNYWYLIEML